MMKAWTGVPWRLSRQYLVLQRWTPDFRPETAVLHKAPVWIIFPGLPVEYCRPDILYCLASRMGSPIKLDEHTAKLKKGSYAKVCVVIPP